MNTLTKERPDGIGALRNHLGTEQSLWERRDEDPAAREELVRRYMPFAVRLASRYRSSHESYDDLIQIASVGLINAVNRFDSGNGSAFASFAAPTITGELKRYFRDRVWLVRVPRGIQEEIHKVDRATAELSAELHRDPTAWEVSDRTSLSIADVEEALQAKQDRNPVSLDVPVSEDAPSPNESFGAEDPGYRVLEDQDEIRTAVLDLDATQRLVLRLRFIDEMTQSEIADRIGFSQMHVSRLLKRSLAALESRGRPA